MQQEYSDDLEVGQYVDATCQMIGAGKVDKRRLRRIIAKSAAKRNRLGMRILALLLDATNKSSNRPSLTQDSWEQHYDETVDALTICEISNDLNALQPSVTKAVASLARLGVVRKERVDGHVMVYPTNRALAKLCLHYFHVEATFRIANQCLTRDNWTTEEDLRSNQRFRDVCRDYAASLGEILTKLPRCRIVDHQVQGDKTLFKRSM